jgi:hypothetical protein
MLFGSDHAARNTSRLPEDRRRSLGALFLAAHPRLSASLWKLIEVLQELVSTAEAPILRVANDPVDIESCWLQVRIPLAMQPAEALAKIDEVDEAWWMRLPPEVGRLVTVDVDYR